MEESKRKVASNSSRFDESQWSGNCEGNLK